VKTLGHYRITGTLGEGGMGVVYAARDERLDRPVAIKMIRRGSAGDRADERFWREARAAASVNHPNICQLYEIGEESGELFIAMELLEGESLATRVSRGPLPLPEAAPIALGVLEALEALHTRGFIHRDLKPSNIFLTPTGVKLLDFGLARSLDADETETRLTGAGTLFGTPQYMTPEQVSGQPVDARTDVFAAGTVLCEMLTGHPPFTGAIAPMIFHAILYDQPPALGGSIAVAAVDRVIHKALAKRPQDRYQTAAAMAEDLRAATRHTDTIGTASPVRAMTRLIVLPFRLLRADPDIDFLSFSLSDALTTSLSGLGSLVVRSSLTASRFAGEAPDLDVIAQKADVDVVLAGTLLRAGEQLRVTAQLLEAPNGTVIWSQTSQARVGDIFQLQDELTHRIVESLSIPLSARDQRLLRHDVPATAKAYEFYLRANQLAYEAKNWTVARDLYLQCLDEDPRYAPAWARLGRIYRVLASYSLGPVEENYQRAQQAFARALEINPDLSIAHNLTTILDVEMGRPKEAMLRLLGQVRQHAGDPELFAGLVQACRYCGLLDAAIVAHEQARRLDPQIRTAVSHAYLMARQYDRTVESDIDDPPYTSILALDLMGRRAEALEGLRAAERRPLPRVLTLWLGVNRAMMEGNREEAAAARDELLAMWQHRDPCAIYYGARTLASLDPTRALAMFRQAVEGGFYCADFYAWDPWLDPLRADPAFAEILQTAERRHLDAREAFIAARGEQILGPA